MGDLHVIGVGDGWYQLYQYHEYHSTLYSGQLPSTYQVGRPKMCLLLTTVATMHGFINHIGICFVISLHGFSASYHKNHIHNDWIDCSSASFTMDGT